MKQGAKWVSSMAVAAVAAITVAVGVAVADASGPDLAGSKNEPEPSEACEETPRRGVQIATAKLIIEFNATDDDLGVHGAFDDHGWSELCVFDPRGRPIAAFDPLNQLDDLTMAGVFFESREPPGSEFSMRDLAAAFPEGNYKVHGKSFDGKTLIGSAKFTHDVPAPPTITAPELAEDPEQPGDPVPRAGLVIDWKPVTKTVDGRPVSITGYEVIVTKENHNDPHGFSRPIYDVHTSAALDSLSVPKKWLKPDTVYEVEVLALEKSGNQTISVGFFVTE